MQKALYITVTILATALVGVNVGRYMQAQDVQNTYQYCMMAHTEVSGESEQKCGDMQDATNTQFMCDNHGQYCWLEVK